MYYNRSRVWYITYFESIMFLNFESEVAILNRGRRRVEIPNTVMLPNSIMGDVKT